MGSSFVVALGGVKCKVFQSKIQNLKSAIEGEVIGMTQWQCSNCGYTFGTDTPPDRCPSCKQTCTFSDVTCYIPDCGGPGNIDPRLATGKRDGIKKKE
jgi:rubredoxin